MPGHERIDEDVVISQRTREVLNHAPIVFNRAVEAAIRTVAHWDELAAQAKSV